MKTLNDKFYIMKKESLKTLEPYKIDSLSSIFGGTGSHSRIGGDLTISTDIKGGVMNAGGVLNAAIGKSN